MGGSNFSKVGVAFGIGLAAGGELWKSYTIRERGCGC